MAAVVPEVLPEIVMLVPAGVVPLTAVLPSCKVRVPLLVPPLSTVLAEPFTLRPWPVAVIRVAELAVPSSDKAGPATELPPAVPPNEDRTAEGVSPPVSVKVAPLTVGVDVDVPNTATFGVVLTLRLAPVALATLRELLMVVGPLKVD